MDPDSLSKEFVEHYYSQFDTNRQSVVGLYQEDSMLTFEGQKIYGVQAISEKFESLGFQQCKHIISTVDCQLSGPAGGMLVFVSGHLQLPGEEHLLSFSQLFHIVPSHQGSFYLFNDVFRLNYAWNCIGWCRSSVSMVAYNPKYCNLHGHLRWRDLQTLMIRRSLFVQ